tara:strand:+ start:360 stop:3488 length:3129 start_codon:yes stop_codon:yes gene_type:complete
MPLISTGPISGSSDDTVRFSHDVDIVGGNLAVSGSISGSAVDSIFFGSDVQIVGGNLVCSGSITAGTDGFIGTFEGGSVVNSAGADVDFRVLSDDETHMLFLDGGNNRISIGDSVDAPAATLEITNHASAGAFGVPLLQLNSNDTDKIAVDINAANIDAHVIDIVADALTTGATLNIASDSSSTSVRKLVNIVNDNTAAVAAVPLFIQNDAAIPSLDGSGNIGATLVLDVNYQATTTPSAGSIDSPALLIDYDLTGVVAASQYAYPTGMRIDLHHNAPTIHAAGLIASTGIDLNMVGGTSGIQTLSGISIDVTGADNNTGLYIDAPAYDADNKHIILASAADSGDRCVIGVGEAGATTIATIDDDAAAANLTFDIDGKIAFEAFAGDEAVFNDGGLDVNFRVESEDETYMFYVDASLNRISIGDSTNDPEATLEITNHASAGAYGVSLLQLNSNDLDQVALDINAANTTAPVIDITADAVTDSYGIHMTVDGLTTGAGLLIDDDSANTGTRSTVQFYQNNAAAIAATALRVQSDGGVTGMLLDKNFTDVAAATVRGLYLDFDRTVPGSGTATFTDIGIDLDVNAAGLGTTTTTGLDIDVVGATSGVHTAIGLAVDVGSADINYAAVFNGGNSGFGCTDPVSLVEIRGPDGSSGAGSAGVLTLSTAETGVAYADVLGKIQFQAPKDSSGSDAIEVAASIEAVSDAPAGFDGSNNHTIFVWKLGESGAAAEKMKLESNGHLQVGTAGTEGGLEVMNKGVFRRSSGRYYLEEFYAKRPALNATSDAVSTTEAQRAANEHFEITGRTDGSFSLFDSNVYWPSISGSSEAGGLAFATQGETGDQMIIQPHQDIAYTSTNYSFQPDQPMTAWSGISWNTSKSVEWECAITTGDVSTYGFWAGLGQSNPGDATWAYATDAHQAFFFSCADDTFGAITTNANMHFIYSVNGTDYITNLDFAMADNTLYRFRISIDSSRQIKIVIDDQWFGITRTTTGTTPGGVTESSYYTSNAMNADKHLIPYVGIQTLGNTYPYHIVHYQKISRVLGLT